MRGESDFETFRTISETADFNLGESLPGLVASEGEPVWIPDVTEAPNFVRSQNRNDLGVRGAFAVPVQVEEETVAVLEFFSAEREEEDEKLVDAIASVGMQLSRVAEREKAQRELKESEEQFRALAEQSLIGIELIQDGVYRYVNPTFADYFGYQQHELIGRSPEAIIHSEDWPRVQETIQRRIEGEREEDHYTARGKTRSGETIYLEIYGRRIQYQGRPAIVGASLDVTEERRLQREMVQIEEEERRRIGQDLHDIISSQLTGASIKQSLLAEKNP